MISVLALALNSVGPHGTRSAITGYSAPKLYQKISCTSAGTLRKNQIYAQLSVDSSRLSDSRITARMVPITSPISIAITVSSSVRASPSRICGLNRYSATTGHSNAGLVATLASAAPAISTTTAVATHVHGWRNATTRGGATVVAAPSGISAACRSGSPAPA